MSLDLSPAIERFLARLDHVRRSGRGWSVRCPAHDDRQPSLSIREGAEGRILIHCFAGCTPAAIVAAVGLRLADLFPDGTGHPQHRQPRRVDRRRWLDWRQTAGRLEDHAMAVRCRAERVLAAAHGLAPEGWADEDFDRAMRVIAWVYEDLRWAAELEEVAFRLRTRGLGGEQQQWSHATS